MKNTGGMKYNSKFLKEDGSLNYSVYAEYFADNIQRVETIDNIKIAEGFSYDEFLENWNKDIKNNVEKINRFLGLSEPDEDTQKRIMMLTTHQERLFELGIEIDYSNLFFLCLFIKEITTNGYVALLKPSAKDMLSMIGDIGKICITNADGTKIETGYNKFISPIRDCLTQITDVDSNTYEVEKFVKATEVTNKEFFQVQFVYYISRFMNEYFTKAHRKTNCDLSSDEQEIILIIMDYLGLTPVIVTKGRLRQLLQYTNPFNKMNKEGKIIEVFGNSYVEGIGWLPIGFVKYEDWKGKRLDLIGKGDNYKFKLSQLEVGDTIVFTKATEPPKM